MAQVASIKKAPADEIAARLVCDRVTKGACRFAEEGEADWPLNLYLRKDQVAALGIEAAEGAAINLTVAGA